MGSDFFDVALLAELLARPGMDTRQWISYGIVRPDAGGDDHSVRFADANGAPIPQGALVDVKLEPSGIVVSCRVLSRSAGAGEGEWDPIGPGDEVLVVIPEGDESAGCVIIGKLSNAFDVMPTTVAGQDVTQNNITFKRMKTPYILETGASWMFRSALTGASISAGATGDILLNDGAGSFLGISSSAITLQEPTGAALLQIDPSALTVTLQADGTAFVVDPNASSFITPGTLSIATAGTSPVYHLATVEGVLNLISNILSMPAFLAGAALGSKGTVDPAIALALPMSTSPGTGAINPAVGTALSVALAAQSDPNNSYGQLALVDVQGVVPGVGRSSFFVS